MINYKPARLWYFLNQYLLNLNPWPNGNLSSFWGNCCNVSHFKRSS